MIPDSLHAHDHVRRHGLDQHAFEKGNHRGYIKAALATAKWKVMAVRIGSPVLLPPLVSPVDQPPLVPDAAASVPGTATSADCLAHFRSLWPLLLGGLWIGALCLALSAARGQEPTTWRVLVEPKFMKAPVTAPIAGAQKSELAAATTGETGPEVLTRAQFAALKVDWEAFTAQAQTNADADLATLKIEYVRDRKKVITYAVVRSARGLAASAVLAAGFPALFKDILGDKLLLAVPNRTTAYIFPRLASTYQEYAPLILEAYRATPYPVTTEVFELSHEGMKAVGVYEGP